MNKYALILPLAVLSFLLGYFTSCFQIGQAYFVVILMIVLVAVIVYMLFLQPKKSEKKTDTK